VERLEKIEAMTDSNSMYNSYVLGLAVDHTLLRYDDNLNLGII